MNPLLYLAHLCMKVDRTYNVSLEYAAHIGDTPCWQMRVTFPMRVLSLVRTLERGDDTVANIAAAQSLGEDIKRLAPWVFRERSEDIISLDSYGSPA